jgi:hypothetical protein
MKVTLELNIEEFKIPKFVQLKMQQGEEAQRSLHISEIPAEALDKLCNQFRASLFLLAKKSQPPVQARICTNCTEEC